MNDAESSPENNRSVIFFVASGFLTVVSVWVVFGFIGMAVSVLLLFVAMAFCVWSAMVVNDLTFQEVFFRKCGDPCKLELRTTVGPAITKPRSESVSTTPTKSTYVIAAGPGFR